MTRILLLAAPVLVLQLGLQIYVLCKILKEGTANLSAPIWILINFILGLLGPIVFLLLGRKGNFEDDQDNEFI